MSLYRSNELIHYYDESVAIAHDVNPNAVVVVDNDDDDSDDVVEGEQLYL